MPVEDPTVETSAGTDETPLVAEVIAIGDELTSGQRLDTNSQWLAQRLTDLGLLVRYHTTVADDLQANIEVFQNAAKRADVVVATGGLGPTADDLTRDAMAAAAGVPLVEHRDLVEHIQQIWTSRGRVMPPQNRRQAQLPEYARAIPNPGGTAPGVDQTVGRCRLFALPGVPAEMIDMWTATVAPTIGMMTARSRVTCHWLVKCFGAGESAIEGMLPDLIARGRYPLVGITASNATITLRVTASGVDEAACRVAMEPTLEEIRTKLGELVFAEQPGGTEELDLQEVVINALHDMGAGLATAEGMTQGVLAAMVGVADDGRGVVQRSRYATMEGRIDDPIGFVAAIARRHANRFGYAVVVGPQGTPDRTRVAVAAATPTDMTAKFVPIFGHPSIQRTLVAKHALNLLRLELLK